VWHMFRATAAACITHTTNSAPRLQRASHAHNATATACITCTQCHSHSVHHTHTTPQPQRASHAQNAFRATATSCITRTRRPVAVAFGWQPQTGSAVVSPSFASHPLGQAGSQSPLPHNVPPTFVGMPRPEASFSSSELGDGCTTSAVNRRRQDARVYGKRVHGTHALMTCRRVA